MPLQIRPYGPADWPGVWVLPEPGEDLENGPFWENVGPICGGYMGAPFELTSGRTARELHHQLMESTAKVGRGASWDATRWDRESARSLSDDDELADAECLAYLPELELLNNRGLLPSELQGRMAAALAAYAVKAGAELARLEATTKMPSPSH